MYTTIIDNLDKLIDEMYESGYVASAPHPDVGVLDAEIVALLRCKECGGTLTYLPFHKKESYRPFTICDECGDTREF